MKLKADKNNHITLPPAHKVKEGGVFVIKNERDTILTISQEIEIYPSERMTTNPARLTENKIEDRRE